MRVGQLQGASLIGEGSVDVCPASLVLHLPLLFDNDDEADYVLERIRPRLEEQCREKGYEVVGWAQMGFSYLFSKDAVRDLATLRKSKPWLIENDPLSRAFYDVLGVTPVSTGAANVLPGLQSGLIRTVASPPVGLVAMQWHSRIKYRVDVKITYASVILVISRKSWVRLPARLQSTVRDTFEKQLAELNLKIRQQNRDALKEIEKGGVETIRPDAEGQATFVQASEEVGKRLVGEYFSQATLDRVHELRREYRRGRQ
jgi:TRAP-type C4-dicarboxylate transport system substrate-binding protein